MDNTEVDISDEKLLLDYRKRGDGGAFAQLYNRYKNEMTVFLSGKLFDSHLVEDVYQDTFHNVVRGCDQYEVKKGTVRQWLYAIAHNKAIDALRCRRRQNGRHVSLDSLCDENGDVFPLEGKDCDPAALVALKERDDRVSQAVERLPEDYRSSVKLHYLQGLKYVEIANVLGIPDNTVKTRVRAGLAMLLRRYRSVWENEEHPYAA